MCEAKFESWVHSNNLASGSIGITLMIESIGFMPGSLVQWSQDIIFEDWPKGLTLKLTWKLSFQWPCLYPQAHGHGFALKSTITVLKNVPLEWACLVAEPTIIILEPRSAVAGPRLEFPVMGLVLGPAKSDVCITLLYLWTAHLCAVLPRLGSKVS